MSTARSNPTSHRYQAGYSPLVLLLAALAAGIVVDRYGSIAAIAWWLIGAAALALWLPVWIRGHEQLASALLLGSTLTTGGAWHHSYWNFYRSDEIGRMVREEIRPIVVEGVAMTSSRWIPAPPPTAMRIVPKGEESEILLWMSGVRDRTTWRPASGWALLRVDGNLQGVRAGTVSA